ncbi:hypothetical protein S2E19_03938 [Bacillus mycoides]|nr:5-methylcytosine-specific restriction enzyme MRR [Bacillus mycoides DSM 2048]OSY02460.1 hypothetical protein S2E19_03938 [Bacillus mycoides]
MDKLIDDRFVGCLYLLLAKADSPEALMGAHTLRIDVRPFCLYSECRTSPFASAFYAPGSSGT